MNPDEMSNQEILDHFRYVHNVSDGLSTVVSNMSHGVILRIRDVHMDHHAEHLMHDHEWPYIGASMAKGWNGLYKRVEVEGLDRRTNQWFYACPETYCYYIISASSEAAGAERGKNHICPHAGPTHIGATVTLEILDESWIAADREYDRLLDANLVGNKLEQQRGVLKGCCIQLSMWSRPHYPDVQSVADELRKRRTQRDAGNTAYESPGVGSRKYEPVKTEEEKVEAMTPKARAGKVLNEEERKGMKFAFQNGFDVPTLARTYSVSMDVVREVCS